MGFPQKASQKAVAMMKREPHPSTHVELLLSDLFAKCYLVPFLGNPMRAIQREALPQLCTNEKTEVEALPGGQALTAVQTLCLKHGCVSLSDTWEINFPQRVNECSSAEAQQKDAGPGS